MDKIEKASIGGPALRRALFGNYMLLIYTALALAGVLTVLNLVIFDHNVRFDLTPSKRFTLSDFDRHVLAGGSNDVKVMCFFLTEEPHQLQFGGILFWVAPIYTPGCSQVFHR